MLYTKPLTKLSRLGGISVSRTNKNVTDVCTNKKRGPLARATRRAIESQVGAHLQPSQVHRRRILIKRATGDNP
jgi:hypothetical protein